MVTLGLTHKRSHTIAAVDANGRQLASKTITTTTKDHLGLLNWAEQLAEDGEGLCWAVEDCRRLSRRLERDLLAAGQSIVRVPPKLMAHVRDSARSYGKSDPMMRSLSPAQREPDLPVARLDGPDCDVRLLSDHREILVAERTRAICRLRWHLLELDPGWEAKSRSHDRISTLDAVAARIQNLNGTVARLARALVDRSRTDAANQRPHHGDHRAGLNHGASVDRDPGLRRHHRSEDSRRDRRRRSIAIQRRVCPPQRNGADASLVVEQSAPPVEPHR